METVSEMYKNFPSWFSANTKPSRDCRKNKYINRLIRIYDGEVVNKVSDTKQHITKFKTIFFSFILNRSPKILTAVLDMNKWKVWIKTLSFPSFQGLPYVSIILIKMHYIHAENQVMSILWDLAFIYLFLDSVVTEIKSAQFSIK